MNMNSLVINMLCKQMAFFFALTPCSDLSAEVHQAYYVKTYAAGARAESSGLDWANATTIDGAKLKVRDLPAPWTGDVHVIMAGGTYYYGATLNLSAQDSGKSGYKVIYRNNSGEIPVFSGGKIISGSWMTYNPSWHYIACTNSFRELTTGAGVADQRAVLARSPIVEQDAVLITSGTYSNCFRVTKSSLVTNAAVGLSYNHPVEISMYTLWTTKLMRVAEVFEPVGDYAYVKVMPEEEAKIAEVPHFSNSISYYFQNSVVFLDEEGEFWKGTTYLHYKMRSGETPSNLKSAYPGFETLLNIEGERTNRVSNIEFRGLVFCDTGWNNDGINMGRQAGTFDGVVTRDKQPSLALIKNANNIDFTFNKFTRVAATAIDFEIGVDQCDVVGNYFHQTGGNGIAVHSAAFNLEGANFDEDIELVKNLRIVQNYFYDCATVCEGSIPIVGAQGVACIVANNEIEKAPYSGISWGWGWASSAFTGGACNSTVIQHNFIHGVMEKLCDGSGIYTLGPNGTMWVPDNLEDPSLDALRIFENCMSNIVRNTSIPNATYPVAAVYFDQNSRNILFEHNTWEDSVFSQNVFYHSEGPLTEAEAFDDWGIYSSDNGTNDVIVKNSAGIMPEFLTAKSWAPAPDITSQNIALNRWVFSNYESSLLPYDYMAIRGTDNNTNTLWGSGNSVSTEPFFFVELKRPTQITKVELVPRFNIDQSFARRSFQVLFSVDGDTWVNLDSQGTTPFPHQTVWSKNCTDTNKYSYVLLEKTAVEPMNFCELRVFD